MASLYDLAMQYLGQSLPDISGIGTLRPGLFPSPPSIGEPEKLLPIDQPEKTIPLATSDDNFSVYNPDPTRTRTKRDYVFPFKFTGEDLPEAGDYISGPTGIRSLLSKLPGQQILQGIAGALPVNRRAIFENQLLGGNFMLDDIEIQ